MKGRKTLKTIKYLSLFLTACSGMRDGQETCFDFTEVAAREPDRVQYTVPVVDFDTQLTTPTAVPDVTTQVCINATCTPELPRCNGDVGQCWREYPGPIDAVKVFDFPYGLTNVVLRLSAPGYVPTDYPMGGPIIGAPDGSLSMRGVGIVLVKQETYAAIHGQVGTVPDPLRGTLAVRVLDCRLQRAEGVEVSGYNADLRGATAFSLSNNNLATAARLQTDQRGVVGFFNLPSQTVDVEVATWNISPVTLNIRPGTLTLAEMRWGLDQFGQ